MIRRLTTALWVALACFHVYLLACQAVDGRLLDSGLLIRWGLGLWLAFTLFSLHRAGVPLWGRKAVAPWLLVTLLHGPVALDRVSAAVPAIQPSAIALVAATLSVGASLVLLAAGLALLRRLTRAVATWPPRAGTSSPARSLRGFGDVLSARPPPLA